MLSQLDNIIFPDRCEVLQINSQRFVYPIQKNGSSSLYREGYQTVPLSDLADIKIIEIFVRDPYDRFLSGVQSYLAQNFALDRKTMLYMVSENLFLNRHYCPQFHWLVNLQRFTTAKIKINPIDKLNEITTYVDNKQARDYDIEKYFQNNKKIEFYTGIDKVLTETLLGYTVRFKDIVDFLRVKQPNEYSEIVSRSIQLGKIIDV